MAHHSTDAAAAHQRALSDEQRAMVEANIPLVEHIANRVMSRLPASHERDDLVQTGLLGLIAAVQRFDTDAGTTFSTYAGRRIEGAIIDQLRRGDWAPRSVRRMERQLRTAADATPDAADNESLARTLGIPLDELQRLRADLVRARVDSLDRSTNAAEDTTIGATVAARDASLDEVMEDKELAGYLRNAMGLLPERHRVVVVGYFFEDRSMTELGELLGVTQSRASQLKDEALRMIRHGLAKTYHETDPVPIEATRATRRQRAFNEALAAPRPWADRIGDDPRRRS